MKPTINNQVLKDRQLLIRNRFLIVVGDTYYYFQNYMKAYDMYQKLEFKHPIEYL